MTRDDLEAANWQALSRYGRALSEPGAHISRIQHKLIDELTATAWDFRAAGIREALNPAPADPEWLVGQAIDVLAGAMGVRQHRARAAGKKPVGKTTTTKRTRTPRKETQ